MTGLFSIENWLTLLVIVLLQAVLGFDNLLYISLEAKKVAPAKRSMVRKVGLGVAVILRLVLLFILLRAIELFQDPIFSLDINGVVEGDVSFHSLIVLLGGIFILYTALREMLRLISKADHEEGEESQRSVLTAITWIVIMNLVFSFDSILSTIALTDVFWVMATAIILSGIGMIALADDVAEFLERNRMYEVLGLFVLMLVGILLISDGGHLAGLVLFGYEVLPMAKSTFYFVLVIMVSVDLVQSRFQRKLNAQRRKTQAVAEHEDPKG